jgi:glycosyltransferase involved in cell wall biosynthesis
MVTVIIPTFDRAKFLRRAIKSVLSQTYKNVKILILDNNSSDNTPDVVKDFKLSSQKLEYIRNEKNIGAINNINLGISLVNTEYYCILGDDDFLFPNFFKHVVRGFEDSEVMFSCSKTLLVSVEKQRISLGRSEWESGFYTPSIHTTQKMFNAPFASTGVVFRNNVPDILGRFDAGGNDTLYLTIASSVFKFYVSDTFGSAFTLHDGSYSHAGGIAREPPETIFEFMNLEIAKITKLPIESEFKVFIIKLIFDYYMPMIRSNENLVFRSLASPSLGEDDWKYPRLANFDLLLGILRLLPNQVLPFLAPSLKKFQRFREEKNYRLTEIDAQPMHSELREILEFSGENFIAVENWANRMN